MVKKMNKKKTGYVLSFNAFGVSALYYYTNYNFKLNIRITTLLDLVPSFALGYCTLVNLKHESNIKKRGREQWPNEGKRWDRVPPIGGSNTIVIEMSRQSSLSADPSRQLLGIDSIPNILPTRAMR